MDARELRRERKRRRRDRHRLAVALTLCAAGFVVVAGYRADNGSRRAGAAAQPAKRAQHSPMPWRPPQFVVVSFDGSGGDQLWPYWRAVARDAHAHFTFFVSGVYLLDEARRTTYRPPRHSAGSSDIGFAQAEAERPASGVIRGMLEQITAAYREGHEIGTHYSGHFCAPYSGSVGEWTERDWHRELRQFELLLFHASENNHLWPHVQLPFGREEVVGARTPCLQGRLKALYRVLAERGFRYDASQVERLGDWPSRELGIWSVPLLEIPFVGHTFRVVSMDYNFLANQVGSSPGTIERETYRSLRRAFRTSYFGNRAPLSYGSHFETWNHGAYNRALARFLDEVCGRPEVRCASARELVDWLDAQPPRLLRRARSGRFKRLKRS